MAYTIKQARPVLLEYLGLTESTANYITDTDNWGILFEKNGQKYVIFIMPLGENTSSPKIYFDIRDSGAEKFVAAWNYAEQNNYKFFCLGVKDESAKYKNYVISVEADIHTVLKVSGLENGRRSGAGTQLNVPSSLVPEGNITRAKSNKFDIFFAVIDKNYIFTYLEVFDNRLFQFINSEASTSSSTGDVLAKSRNRIIFGAPGTGKSHEFQKDLEKYFSSLINYEQLLKEEIQTRPQEVDKEPWFNHIGMKYANYVYKLSHEKSESELQELWDVSQNELWKMKTAARATIDYKHAVLRNCEESSVLYERVTFHPNYSYAQFVGTYKPIQNPENLNEIRYEYIPGPFIRTFIQAKKTDQNVLLLIEEINRANVAAVFGDIFQLLDRDVNGNSEYPITTSEDLRKFLAKPENLGGSPEDYTTISIPSNMYIWATMNSADQGVLPMDAAFKRRWEFEYINIDDGAGELNGVTIPIPNGKNADDSIKYVSIEWNTIRTAINEQLKKVSGVNEDKLLGPFFIGDKTKIENAAKNPEQFCKSFKSKVLMYLFEDVVKMQPGELFDSKEGINIHYSDICKDFDSKGLKIFVKSVYEQFPEFANGDSE